MAPGACIDVVYPGRNFQNLLQVERGFSACEEGQRHRIPKNASHETVNRRTIENPQGISIFRDNFCLKVYKVHL